MAVLSQLIMAVLFSSGLTLCERTAKPTRATLPQGIWEADEGQSGTVGINLWEVSSSVTHGGPPNPEEVTHPVLQIGVYERSGTSVQCGEENFFDTGWRGHKDVGVQAAFTNGVLIVTYPQFPNETAINLELTWHPDTNTWTGRFHRGSFDKVVTLHHAPDRRTHDQELCMVPSSTNH
jgi:hypothetical protein